MSDGRGAGGEDGGGAGVRTRMRLRGGRGASRADHTRITIRRQTRHKSKN